MSTTFDLPCLMVLFAIPAEYLLSVWMGVGDYGCPSS